MPVIIRELVIRATINDMANQELPSAAIITNAQEKEALVKECVEQVLAILEKRKENKTS